MAKESKSKENNARISCLIVLFLEKRHISQVIHFKEGKEVHSLKVRTLKDYKMIVIQR